ncbi:MAG: hypothetical protein QNI84_06515 [Henriciella sp.]|nr:hypothetical protein [Henriciella sp.]
MTNPVYDPTRTVRFAITPTLIMSLLSIALAAILAAHCFALYLHHGSNWEKADIIVDWLHMGRERNLPTLYSVFIIACAGGMCLLMPRLNVNLPEGSAGWNLIGYILLALSLDELVSIHERIGWRLQESLNLTGPLYFAWVIPYAAFALIVAVILLPWLLRLDFRTKAFMIVAGGIYLTGAIGMELIGASIHYENLLQNIQTDDSLKADVMVTIEETLEIAGMSLFLATVLTALSHRGGRVVFNFAEAEPTVQPQSIWTPHRY